MNKYNGLLSEVANKYNIRRGMHEAEINWKTRLVYSICGMMAYASLWDESEDEPVSIIHLKRRIRRVLSDYKTMYPELANSFPYVSADLEDEIAGQLLSTGMVYHRPNRIAPSMRREESYCNIVFQRGISLDSICCVSGIGLYSRQECVSDADGIQSMFGLERETLHALWNSTLANTDWKVAPTFEQSIEYLRLKPPFSQGYWEKRPDTTGTVSMLRTDMEGSQLYYLYRYRHNAMEISPLPKWQVENSHYRSIACACLQSYGTMPPIDYVEDGELVHLRLNYLLPPHELGLVKLYSWPEVCTSLPCDFRRKLTTELFVAVKKILSDKGYELKGKMI